MKKLFVFALLVAFSASASTFARIQDEPKKSEKTEVKKDEKCSDKEGKKECCSHEKKSKKSKK